MSASTSKDIANIVQSQSFRDAFCLALCDFSMDKESSEVFIDMLYTYFTTRNNPKEKVILLPRGYSLHVKKRGGIFFTHSVRDCTVQNKLIKDSVPYWNLYFIRSGYDLQNRR
jgi:hypothetical protein